MLTYKPNKTATLHAAYRGSVRVGYVAESTRGGYTWNLYMLRPAGGGYMGRCDTMEKARQEMSESFLSWMRCADLIENR